MKDIIATAISIRYSLAKEKPSAIDEPIPAPGREGRLYLGNSSVIRSRVSVYHHK
jgi:hypothetical protein